MPPEHETDERVDIAGRTALPTSRHDAEDRVREKFGGFNRGAAFFGWPGI